MHKFMHKFSIIVEVPFGLIINNLDLYTIHSLCFGVKSTKINVELVYALFVLFFLECYDKL